MKGLLNVIENVYIHIAPKKNRNLNQGVKPQSASVLNMFKTFCSISEEATELSDYRKLFHFSSLF